MSWSYIPRWKFTDSAEGRVCPEGSTLAAPTTAMCSTVMQLDARCSKPGLRSSAVPGWRQLSTLVRYTASKSHATCF